MTTNNNIVKEQIQKHILEYQSMNELKENVKALQCQSNYNAIIDMVEGGTFLIYNIDVKEFINSLGINPTGKEFDTQKTWNLYKHLIAREGANLLERSAK